MKKVTDQTYGYNNKQVEFHELPQALQTHITQAYDFYNQLDAAKTPEEVTRLCNEHPFNRPVN